MADWEILRDLLLANPLVFTIENVPDDHKPEAIEEAGKYNGAVAFEYLAFMRQYILRTNKTLVGVQNGSNKLFTITDGGIFTPGGTMLFRDGSRLTLGVDYTEVGNDKIQLTVAPSGNVFVLDYIPGS